MFLSYLCFESCTKFVFCCSGASARLVRLQGWKCRRTEHRRRPNHQHPRQGSFTTTCVWRHNYCDVIVLCFCCRSCRTVVGGRASWGEWLVFSQTTSSNFCLKRCVHLSHYLMPWLMSHVCAAGKIMLPLSLFTETEASRQQKSRSGREFNREEIASTCTSTRSDVTHQWISITSPFFAIVLSQNSAHPSPFCNCFHIFTSLQFNYKCHVNISIDNANENLCLRNCLCLPGEENLNVYVMHRFTSYV